MVTSPYDCLTTICVCSPFGVRFNWISGDKCSYEIAGVHLVNVESICYVVDHTKPLFNINAGITTGFQSVLVQWFITRVAHIFEPSW